MNVVVYVVLFVYLPMLTGGAVTLAGWYWFATRGSRKRGRALTKLTSATAGAVTAHQNLDRTLQFVAIGK